jgi:hypothetical protein
MPRKLAEKRNDGGHQCSAPCISRHTGCSCVLQNGRQASSTIAGEQVFTHSANAHCKLSKLCTAVARFHMDVLPLIYRTTSILLNQLRATEYTD